MFQICRFPSAVRAVAGALVAALVPAVAHADECQDYHRATARQIEAEFESATRACTGPNSAPCFRQARDQKAASLRALGEFVRNCGSLKPIGPGQMDPRMQWSNGGPGVSIYTDEKSQRWVFRDRVEHRTTGGSTIWTLQRATPPRVKQAGSIRQVYATYREVQNRQPPQEFSGTLQ